MLKVEVEKVETRTLEGTSQKNGKPYKFKIQEAYIYLVDPTNNQPHRHPTKFDIMLDADEQPYAPGFYQLSVGSIEVNRGRLMVNPFLQSAKPAATASSVQKAA